MNNRGSIGRSGLNNRGSMVSRGSMDNRGSMVGRGSMVSRSSMVSRGSMDNRGSMVSRGSMNNWGSMDNRGSIGRTGLNNWSIRVHSSSFIGNISNISIITISMVVHMLGTTIRKSNGVRSRDSSCTISSLFSIESRIGVVISNSVSIGVGGRLIRVSWLSSVISRGNLDNWGSMVGRGSMY